MAPFTLGVLVMGYRKKEPETLPCCGATVTGQTQVTALGGTVRDPKEGDLSICGDCGRWMRFGKGLKLRLFTADDFQEVPDSELKILRRMSAAYRLNRRSQG